MDKVDVKIQPLWREMTCEGPTRKQHSHFCDPLCPSAGFVVRRPRQAAGGSSASVGCWLKPPTGQSGST